MARISPTPSQKILYLLCIFIGIGLLYVDYKTDYFKKIKYTIGCATAESEKLEMSITGRNLAEGIPETFAINSEQIFEAMKDPLFGMVRAIRNALELSPPELAADIAERGIVLTGGGALMRDLDKLISSSTGIPVIVAEDPLTCVARGGGQALEIMDKYNIDLLSSE